MQKINVFYEGWGERFHWATLGAADLRSPVIFEYTEAAFQRGLELSPYLLPLQRGRDFSKVLFQHQMGLPGPAYDSLPDGWGLLLMDRLFRQRGLEPSKLSVLDRLAYIGNTAMGAMAFEPASGLDASEAAPIPLEQLAREVQLVLEDKDTALLKQLALVGGSPHGARPKALVYIDTKHQRASTVPMQEGSPWLVKFPAMHEPSEVCAIEDLYCKSARRCGIDVPETLWMDLGGDLSAFGIQRFDREGGHKVPIHTLAAFVGADFRQPTVRSSRPQGSSPRMCGRSTRRLSVRCSMSFLTTATTTGRISPIECARTAPGSFHPRTTSPSTGDLTATTRWMWRGKL